MNHAFNFFLTADNRVDFAVACKFCQITAKLGKRVIAVRSGIPRTGCLTGFAAVHHIFGNIIDKVLQRNAGLHQNLRCAARGFPRNGKQDMFCADQALPHAAGKGNSGFNNVFASRRKIIGNKFRRYADADGLLDIIFYLVISQLAGSQNRARNS